MDLPSAYTDAEQFLFYSQWGGTNPLYSILGVNSQGWTMPEYSSLHKETPCNADF